MKQITCPHCGDTYPDFDVAHVCSKGPYAPRLKPKMNERIKELAEQAGLRFTQLMSNPMVPVVDGKETDLEKFAELIVKECITKVELRREFAIEDDHNVDEAFSLLIYDIESHFGVEE